MNDEPEGNNCPATETEQRETAFDSSYFQNVAEMNQHIKSIEKANISKNKKLNNQVEAIMDIIKQDVHKIDDKIQNKVHVDAKQKQANKSKNADQKIGKNINQRAL